MIPSDMKYFSKLAIICGVFLTLYVVMEDMEC